MKKELLHKRTVNTKLFDLGNNQFELIKSPVPIHYFNNGVLEDIDTNFVDKGTYYEITKAPYDGIIFKDKIKYQFTAKTGGRVDVELREIGGVDILNLNLNINLIKDKNDKLIYKNVLQGLDIIIVANQYKFEAYKILNNNKVPVSFKWDVFEDKKTDAKFITKTAGVDSNNKEINLLNNNSVSNYVTKTKIDLNKISFYEEFTNEVKIRNRKTRIKSLSKNVKYPIIIDASVSINVSANADDGYESSSASWHSWVSNIQEIRISVVSIYNYNGGFKFNNVTIPQGATINSASMVWFVTNNAQGQTIKIYGDNVDSAVVWSKSSLPSNMTKTTAFGSFSPTAVVGNTTNAPITSPLQEIINRAGWISGNNVRFGAFPQVVGKSFKVADFANANPQASLSVVYTVGAPPTQNSNFFNFF